MDQMESNIDTYLKNDLFLVLETELIIYAIPYNFKLCTRKRRNVRKVIAENLINCSFSQSRTVCELLAKCICNCLDSREVQYQVTDQSNQFKHNRTISAFRMIQKIL